MQHQLYNNNLFELDTPAGTLIIALAINKVAMIDWKSNPRHSRVLAPIVHAIATNPQPEFKSLVVDEITRYFNGNGYEPQLPVIVCGTPFQKRIWEELRKIPYGTTASYSAIARNIGMPAAVRAVANAVGANRLNIIIPCHRIIQASGAQGGYAGGKQAKRYLLNMEQHNANNLF